jgi:hypothetical protein
MNAENTAQRLQETAAKCLSSLDAWNKDLKNTEARESLLEAVHELRKVTSRLEIDIAMNDRENVNSNPIPIPEHKSKIEKKKQKPLSDILPVAELREKGEKRKIAIQEAEDAAEDNVHDDPNIEVDDTSENDEPKKKIRKPRRKKTDNDD